MQLRELSSQIFRLFAKERRRVISEWRVLVAARRVATLEREPLPAAPIARRLLDRAIDLEEVTSISGVGGVYLIDLPFADTIEVTDEQIVQEANPWAVFSHLSALAHHGMTDVIPDKLYATYYPGESTDHVPLGTTPEDWVDLPLPGRPRPKRVGKVKVIWSQTKGEWAFGRVVSYSGGAPIYVTDRERTLLDGLRSPEKSGGIMAVIRAWRFARDQVDTDRLVEYVDGFGSPILRQRAGFALEAVGLGHSRLDEWRETLQRGGSLKLVASAPYSPRFSERWNLSLNVPESLIAELNED